MISIHLYCKLRKHTEDKRPSGNNIVRVEVNDDETLERVLKRSGINLAEVYTIFLNAKLLTNHNRMAHCLEYPLAIEYPHSWDLSVLVKDGDKVGLFSRDIPALVV